MPQMKLTRFAKGVNRGTAKCSECDKVTWQSRIQDMGGGYKLCETCFNEAGMENEHSDTGGDHNGRGPVPDECPACREDVQRAREMGPVEAPEPGEPPDNVAVCHEATQSVETFRGWL